MSTRNVASRIFFLFFFCLTAVGEPTPRGAQIFNNEAEQKDLLFKVKQTGRSEPNGTFFLVTEYADPKGEVAVLEETTYKEHHLTRYRLSQKQEDTLILFEVEEGRSIYNKTNLKTGEIKTSKDGWGPEYLILGDLLSFVHDHWDGLMMGNTIHFRLAVPEKMQSYGYKVFNVEEDPVIDKNRVTLKVKPSSPFISLFSDPTILIMDRKTKGVVQMTGPALPKIATGPNKFKDFISDTVYDKEAPPKPAPASETAEPAVSEEATPVSP